MSEIGQAIQFRGRRTGRIDSARPIVRSALARGATYREAAAEAGVSGYTVHSLLTEPEFLESVRSARVAAYAETTRLLDEAVPDAVRALHKIVQTENVSVHARVRAAEVLLSQQHDRFPVAQLIDVVRELSAQLTDVEGETVEGATA